jgi:hypothetical protein
MEQSKRRISTSATRYDHTHGLLPTFQLTNRAQWDSNSLWESRYIWLPVAIDENKKSLEVQWQDVYDLDM